MNFMLKNIFVILLAVIVFTAYSYGQKKDKEQPQSQEVIQEQAKDDVAVKIIERENYEVRIKQYDEKYPVVVYVVFRESTPLLSEINKILKTELLALVNTESIKNNIIASAWFDDKVSDELEKIELAKNYGAFVLVLDDKGRQILNFADYLKYLKKKKEEKKEEAKSSSHV